MSLIKMKTVEEEMKKNPELTNSDLNMLKDWLKKQPHLPPMSDYELVLFLHSNYYRTESTKLTIDTFFTVRTHVPEFFSGRDPSKSKELRDIMKVICCISLPTTTPEGYRVAYANLIDCEPSHYVFPDAIKLIFLVMDICHYSRGTAPGYIMIVDMKGCSFGHLARLSPMAIKKFIYFLQNAIPFRMKGIHFINSVPVMDMMLNIARPFMKKELMNIVHIHLPSTILSEKIALDVLPNDVGGKAGPVKDLWEAQIKEIEKHSAWLQEEETRRVNEALRPGKAINATHIFGVEGSFKKLDID